jgi:hypothetical protein
MTFHHRETVVRLPEASLRPNIFIKCQNYIVIPYFWFFYTHTSTWMPLGLSVRRVPRTCVPPSFNKKRMGSREAFAHTTHFVR